MVRVRAGVRVPAPPTGWGSSRRPVGSEWVPGPVARVRGKGRARVQGRAPERARVQGRARDRARVLGRAPERAQVQGRAPERARVQGRVRTPAGVRVQGQARERGRAPEWARVQGRVRAPAGVRVQERARVQARPLAPARLGGWGSARGPVGSGSARGPVGSGSVPGLVASRVRAPAGGRVPGVGSGSGPSPTQALARVARWSPPTPHPAPPVSARSRQACPISTDSMVTGWAGLPSPAPPSTPASATFLMTSSPLVTDPKML